MERSDTAAWQRHAGPQQSQFVARNLISAIDEMQRLCKTLASDRSALRMVTADVRSGVEFDWETLAGEPEGDRELGQQTEQLISDLLLAVEARIQEDRGKLSTIGDIRKYLRAVVDVASVGPQLSQQLRAITLMIAVQSNRLPEAREMFSGFVEEMAALAESIDQDSTRIRKTTEAARLSQKNLHENASRAINGYALAYRRCRHTIENALQRIEQMLLLHHQHAETVRKTVRCMVEQIESAHDLMQSSDSDYQQLDQWLEAMASCLASMSTAQIEQEAMAPSFSFDAYMQWGVWYRKAGEKIGALSGCYERITTIFSELAGLASDHFNQELFRCDDRSEQEWSHWIESLSTALEQLGILWAGNRSMQCKTNQSLEQIVEMSEQFSGYVDKVTRISRTMNMQALNAIVKSASLPVMGDVLEVPSQAVARMSGAVDQYAVEMVQCLQKIEECSSTFDRWDEASGEQFIDPEHAVETIIEKIRQQGLLHLRRPSMGGSVSQLVQTMLDQAESMVRTNEQLTTLHQVMGIRFRELMTGRECDCCLQA